jgi:hypothetical protein
MDYFTKAFVGPNPKESDELVKIRAKAKKQEDDALDEIGTVLVNLADDEYNAYVARIEALVMEENGRRAHAATVQMHLAPAFDELRAAGYFAEQNFYCCQSCGCANVPKDKQDTYVFYHAQDADVLYQDGSCHIAWGGDPKFICDTFARHNIRTKHDGSSDHRIEIILPPAH